jgi:hypothetical protein
MRNLFQLDRPRLTVLGWEFSSALIANHNGDCNVTQFEDSDLASQAYGGIPIVRAPSEDESTSF